MARSTIDELAQAALFYGLVNNVARASTTSLERTAIEDMLGVAHINLAPSGFPKIAPSSCKTSSFLMGESSTFNAARFSAELPLLS
ncbi:hypothetical protein [Noviherbaspirillum cavernae]|nr:hypothetical protein [Noviherbaspirillum cavernae]